MIKDISNCRKVKMSHHIRRGNKGNARESTMNMEEDQIPEVELSTPRQQKQ